MTSQEEEVKKEEKELYEILELLSRYHTHLLQNETLKTQEPISLNRMISKIDAKGNDILYFIKTREYPIKKDEKINDLLGKLSILLAENSFKKSTYSKYWTRHMFQEYPFSISANHIENLYKNSILRLEEEEDGVDE